MSKRTSIIVPVVFLLALGLMGCGKSTPTTPVGGDTVAPAAVLDLQCMVPTGVTAVVLKWKESPEVDLAGYRIYRSTNGGTSVLLNSNGSAGFRDGTVSGGSTYVYMVSAYDLSSNESTKVSTGPVSFPTPIGNRDPDQQD